MIAECTLVGFVGQDPEIREVGDKIVATVSIASTRKWRGKDGEMKEKTSWFRCEVWGKQAEVVQKYVKKGSLLGVVGEMEIDEYEKDGEKKKAFKVRVVKVKLMPRGTGKGGDSGSSSGGGTGGTGGSGTGGSGGGGGDGFGDIEEDIPF